VDTIKRVQDLMQVRDMNLYSPQVFSVPAMPQPYACPGLFLYPERRLWSIFRCDFLSTAPWSSAHPKSDRSKPCHRCSPFRYTVLLRCSIVESWTKCNSVPKEPAVLQPITSYAGIHVLDCSANTDSAFHSGHLPLLLRYWVGLSCRSPQILAISVMCALIVFIIDYLRAKRKSVSMFAALLDIGVIL